MNGVAVASGDGLRVTSYSDPWGQQLVLLSLLYLFSPPLITHDIYVVARRRSRDFNVHELSTI
jgi:hypothetical protein